MLSLVAKLVIGTQPDFSTVMKFFLFTSPYMAHVMFSAKVNSDSFGQMSEKKIGIASPFHLWRLAFGNFFTDVCPIQHTAVCMHDTFT